MQGFGVKWTSSMRRTWLLCIPINICSLKMVANGCRCLWLHHRRPEVLRRRSPMPMPPRERRRGRLLRSKASSGIRWGASSLIQKKTYLRRLGEAFKCKMAPMISWPNLIWSISTRNFSRNQKQMVQKSNSPMKNWSSSETWWSAAAIFLAAEVQTRNYISEPAATSTDLIQKPTSTTPVKNIITPSWKRPIHRERIGQKETQI